ncbi:DUF2946 family protein [Pseudaquabacterium pictum]|uniref:DUF2946 domain-containing protein n=1 Tax=Pseudaquabacterium pictum TaxID=2315236 RepID=A0A480AVY3_9BURK|nr:DUF2946 family protein [Rubrivivax pictus]GCL64267.1 hypothetical protein AQPW35_33480 [Rubrivivax pictus]
MLGASMRQRLLALSLSLLLLLTQQLGALHLLSHVLQPPGLATLETGADSGPHGHDHGHHHGDHHGDGGHADAGDALCQICLVLATLGAASLPVVWGWLARQARGGAPLPMPRPAPRRLATAPWQARAPPLRLH